MHRFLGLEEPINNPAKRKKTKDEIRSSNSLYEAEKRDRTSSGLQPQWQKDFDWLIHDP